jgi:DNA-binding transcriptional LysR family regulator
MKKSQKSNHRADLNEVAMFAAVAEARSFTGAARKLGIPISTVSRKVSQLEDRLGITLLIRTTRHVRTTEIGDRYLAECERLLVGLEAAEASVIETATIPSGCLRLTAPTDFGANQHFMELLNRILQLYPDIKIECLFDNKRLDLAEDRIDIAIRAGRMDDSDFVAKKLGQSVMRLMASPEFLERNGPINSISEIEKLPFVRLSTAPQHSKWTLTGPSGQHLLQVDGPITANSIGGIARLAALGLGVAVLPDFRSEPSTEKLKVVLPEWTAGDTPMHIVYPTRRLVPARLTAFVNYLIDEVDAGRLPPFPAKSHKK